MTGIKSNPQFFSKRGIGWLLNFDSLAFTQGREFLFIFIISEVYLLSKLPVFISRSWYNIIILAL